MRRALGGLLLALAVVTLLAGGAWSNHWASTSSGAPLHWADNDPSHPRGYVYWVDNTGSEWPVYSSAIAWDQASRLDAVYVSSESACPNTGHCVSVSETTIGDSACGPTLGQTNQVAYVATGHLTTSTWVHVDTACSDASAEKRRTIVCHELGHSIGLDEQTVGTSSCMRSPYIGPWTAPSAHDFDAIASTYSHND
ncbi:MAG: hypothetical protein NTV23_00690 [Propionibacteriales bacterium]|nr:hypothetical protein [Propionibacteriales bacterium]